LEPVLVLMLREVKQLLFARLEVSKGCGDRVDERVEVTLNVDGLFSLNDYPQCTENKNAEQ
jgi:hypothetical protein